MEITYPHMLSIDRRRHHHCHWQKLRVKLFIENVIKSKNVKVILRRRLTGK